MPGPCCRHDRIHVPGDVVARHGVLCRDLSGVPGLRQHGETAGEAIAAIEKIVREDVAAATADGWIAPESLTDREYSGRFVLRISPELHALLAVEATEQRVSLNQWVVQKLVGRTDPRGF